MFSECEKWRVEFGVEELKRTFVFEEKEEVWRYYPQYYHKTDKVLKFLPLRHLFSLSVLTRGV
jgi:hypothetical protein